MLKLKSPKGGLNLRLHNRVITGLESNYPLLVGVLRLLLVHSIQEQTYLDTVKHIYNFLCKNLEDEGILSTKVKKLIVESIRDALARGADEICSMINNSRLIGFTVSLEKFKSVFKFLNSECSYTFLDIQLGINSEYFLERILINKISYRNYCAKKCKGININDSKYNPNRVESQTPCLTHQYLAHILHKLLIGQPLSSYEIERLFDVPNLSSKISQEQKQHLQKNILNDIIIYYQLIDDIEELQKFINIVNLHPVTIKDYAFLLKTKILLLDNHNAEAASIDCLSQTKLEFLRDLIVDIKNTIDKIDPHEFDLNLIMLVKNISEDLALFCFEKHFCNDVYLELKSISCYISDGKDLSPEDTIRIALTLFRGHGADSLVSLNRTHVLEKCIELLNPYLLLNLVVVPGVFSLHLPLNHNTSLKIENKKLLDWFILNQQVKESNDTKIFSLYQAKTGEMLEALPQSSLLFILMREEYIVSEGMYYAHNNDIVKLQNSLREYEQCPSIYNPGPEHLKINFIYKILENQDTEEINLEVFSIADSIDPAIFRDSEIDDNVKNEDNFTIFFIYRELSNRIEDQSKAIEYFDKASDILDILNKAFLDKPMSLCESNIVQSNQSMVILAIKHGLDYQKYINYFDKASSIIRNESFILDIRRFKGFIADIEKYKDQIDLAALISKVVQNNSISKLSQALRDEYKEEVGDSKLLIPEKQGVTLTESVKDDVLSEVLVQQQDSVNKLDQNIQSEAARPELTLSKASPPESQEQPAAFVKIDYHAIAIKAKSDEIAYHFQQIFQKSKEAAKKAIWHKIIPSWSIDGQKYTSASPEVVEIWDNIYAILLPQLLSSMPSKIREQCENAFYKGYASRFKGSNGFKLIEKLVWELKGNSDIRWAVKSKNIDVITKSVLLIVGHQTDHQGIKKLVLLKRTGKIFDTIGYSNLSLTDEWEKIPQADYDLGYDNVDIYDSAEEGIEMFLTGGSAGGYG